MLVQIYSNLNVLENFLDGQGQKWVRPVWWRGSKINYEWTGGISEFLHVDTDSQKLKAGQKFLGWALSKMNVANLFMGL